MAVRLTVLMIQTSPPTGQGASLFDAMVGELIGAPGMDLTLVGAAKSWQATSTDRMTIESIAGDVAVLDFATPNEIAAKLHTVDTTWQRSRHASDVEAEVAGAGAKKLYAFDMTTFAKAGELLDLLKTLLQSRQVKTFSVGLGGTTLMPATRPAHSSTPAANIPDNQTSNEPASNDTSASIDLDALCDQLDELDF